MELERAIAERFQVTAHVVPVPPVISDVDRLERVAMTAARLLGGFVDSNATVGVAWGSTMSAVSRHLVPKDVQNVVVVQMNGAGNTQTTGIDYASRILQRFGDAYGAQVQQFAVPAFFDEAATKEALWRERSVMRLLDVQARMNVAVFSLGSPFAEVPSHVYIGGYLDAERIRKPLARRGGRRPRDGVLPPGRQFRTASPSTPAPAAPTSTKLRRVARRVCVVSGVQKLATLRGALAGSLVTDLVLDETLATQTGRNPTELHMCASRMTFLPDAPRLARSPKQRSLPHDVRRRDRSRNHQHAGHGVRRAGTAGRDRPARTSADLSPARLGGARRRSRSGATRAR